MGFCGLNHWCESDNAADFYSQVLDKIGDLFLKEVKMIANEYNTDGDVNVALVAEHLLQNIIVHKGDKLYSALCETMDSLEKKIKILQDLDDWGSKEDTVQAFARMISSLDKILSND